MTDLALFSLARFEEAAVLRLESPDGTNRLTRACVQALTKTLRDMAREPRPLVLTGNERFFSAGADLKEIAALTGPEAYEFSKLGQSLMETLDRFPVPVGAAVSGYCMGGGLDLALACDFRIASPQTVFGHRGAALGLITGWGGTQRLPRLIGRTRALQMFVTAEKLSAPQAVQWGLVDGIADDPVREALRRIGDLHSGISFR